MREARGQDVYSPDSHPVGLQLILDLWPQLLWADASSVGTAFAALGAVFVLLVSSADMLMASRCVPSLGVFYSLLFLFAQPL